VGRPDELGNGTLYINERLNGIWQPARHLGAGINSTATRILSNWITRRALFLLHERPRFR
jgi:hypothetical protein